MNPLEVITSNYVLNVGFLAWFAAQFIKTFLCYVSTKKINWERMVGSGGMPSSHSSLVCAIAVGMAKKGGIRGAGICSFGGARGHRHVRCDGCAPRGRRTGEGAQ